MHTPLKHTQKHTGVHANNPEELLFILLLVVFHLQIVPRNLVPIPHTFAAWFAGLSQRQESRRHRTRSVCTVRNRRTRTIKSRARLWEAFNQCDGRRGPESRRMAQCNGELLNIVVGPKATTSAASSESRPCQAWLCCCKRVTIGAVRRKKKVETGPRTTNQCTYLVPVRRKTLTFKNTARELGICVGAT